MRICTNCGSTDIEDTIMLKHIWHHCNECTSSRVSLRRSNFFHLFPVKQALKLITYFSKKKLQRIENNLLIDADTSSDNGGIYAKYSTYVKEPQKLKPWQGQAQKRMELLDNLSIPYKGKRILFISGGPGLIAHEFSDIAEVYVTEYDSLSVQAIAHEWSLDTRKFDVNNDRLTDIFDIKFDIIFAESVINYCGDQHSLVSDLASIINDDGTLIVNNDIPSIGYMLTWQFVDYIPFNFVNIDAFKSMFTQRGFYIADTKRSKYNSLVYRFGIGGWKNKLDQIFRLPFWLFYLVRFHLLNKNINRKFWSLSVSFVLRRTNQKNRLEQR